MLPTPQQPQRQTRTRRFLFGKPGFLLLFFVAPIWIVGTATAWTTPRRIKATNRNRMTSLSSLSMSMLSSDDSSKEEEDSPSPPRVSTTISPRIIKTLDPCVVLMKELIGKYASEWESKGGIYSLAQGVVYWEPPPTCQDALVEAVVLQPPPPDNNHSLLHTYGPAQGIPELVAALQTKIQVENNLCQHSVMVTVGANQAYMNCVLTLLDDKSQGVVFAPYYFNHLMAIQMTCGKDSVLVGPSYEDGRPDIDWLRHQLQQDKDDNDHDGNNNAKKIKMVTMVNPGNPTGVFLTRQELQPIVDVCREFGVWLILDATYEYFIPPHSLLPTFPDDPHVIHIFSFSKSYALAGYRCGYLVLHKNLEEYEENYNYVWDNLLKVQDTIPIGPPRISQVAALGALRAGPDWVRDQYATLEQSRQWILNAMQGLVQTMGGSGAMYVMGKFPLHDNDTIAEDVEICRVLVAHYGVAVIPGSYCGYPGWIRVCYANLEPQMCALAAQRLQQGLTQILRDGF